MENASKAILIAGAILLVIAIIAIGVGLLGKAENEIEGITDNLSYVAQTYNNNLIPYLDTPLTAKTYNDLKTAAAKNGMEPISNAAKIFDYQKILKIHSATIPVNAITAKITGYITLSDINGTNINPKTGNLLTKEDVGKIRQIVIMADNNRTNVVFELDIEGDGLSNL